MMLHEGCEKRGGVCDCSGRPCAIDRTCYATLIPKHRYEEDLGDGNWRCVECGRIIHVEVVPIYPTQTLGETCLNSP